jgi:uncharacterized membrane protein YdjX (TVP38/TMEM64 family)
MMARRIHFPRKTRDERETFAPEPLMSTPPESLWSRSGKGVSIVLGLIALGAAWRFLPVKDWVTAFSGWVEQRGIWGYAIFIAAYAVATILFFPGSLMTIGAGLAFGLWRGFATVSAGSTLGAALAFLIARYCFRKKVEAVTKENPKFAAMDEAIDQGGWKMVALLRLSPLLPFNLSNYLYGVTKIGFWSYLAASWLGMIPGTFLYVYLGAAGKIASGGGEAGPWRWVLFGAGLVATVAVTVWISRLAKKAASAKV